MDEDLKELLREAGKLKTQELTNCSDKERSKILLAEVEAITKVLTDQDKIMLDYEMRERIQEAETKLKKQANMIAIAGIVLPAVITIVGGVYTSSVNKELMNILLTFEEKGTMVTQASRIIIPRLFFKKK